MPSVLAIVSKAVFEKMAPNAQVGDLVKTDRYVSKHAAFDKLGGDGAIYLVTVRPPDEQLWLVGVLEGLKKRNGAWIGKANATKIASITDAMPELGITAKKGVLGMSLQTPRVLAEEVAAVLRERAGSAPSKRAATATAKSTSGKPAAAEPATRGKPVVEPSTRGKPVAQPTRGKPAAQRRRGKPVAPPPVAAPPPREVYKFVPAPKLDAAGKALLAKVLADPDDLATRGVFADHLIELGDPRGEYIQLALAHGGLADGDPKRAELADRLAELHGRHLRLHLEPLLGAKPEGLREHGFANGMIEAVELRAGSIKSLSKLAAVAPIRDVTISDYERPDNWLAQLAASPALPQIRKLQLSCSEDDPKLEAKLLALFESGQLAGLRALILGAPLTDRLVTAIAGTCRELHVLELRGEGTLAAATLGKVAELPLTSLALADIALDRAGLAAVARSKSITRLELQDLHAPGDVLDELARSPGKLDVLELSHWQIADDLPKLLASDRLAHVRSLHIDIGPLRIEKLLDRWAPRELETLYLDTTMGTAGAKALVASKHFAKLRDLSLWFCNLRDAGAQALARWEAEHLERVDLSGNNMTVNGFKALAKGSLLANVRRLDIGTNKCFNDGALALAEAPWLANLRELALFSNWIGVKGVRALLERMPNATVLNMGENNYGGEPLRVAARGVLPKLRRIFVQNPDEDSLDAYLESGCAHTLHSLSVRNMAITKHHAELLAQLPCLGHLATGWCTYEAGAEEILDARFPFRER